ncbi:hypothetical protein D9615_009442 [Tricholomella constricta]|uniref:Uncharacterized protein n=1 Tax=Tricholomella constricta TaxID=117010 RepID=A0A8H5LX96_9AGAR|nr:hypothetical protein D9615_009442 [Tricholomella constricta]
MSLTDPPVISEDIDDDNNDHENLSHNFPSSVSLPELPPLVPFDAHGAAISATTALSSPSAPQPISSPTAHATALPILPSVVNVDVGMDLGIDAPPPAPAPAPTARQPPTRRGSRRGLDNTADSAGPKPKSKGKEREAAVEPPSDGTAAGGSTAPAYGLEAPSSSLRGVNREEALCAFRNSVALASQLQNVTQAVATLSSTSDSRHRDLMNIINDAPASRAPFDAGTFQSSLTNDTRFRHLYQTVYTHKADLEAMSRSLLEARRDINQLRSMPREPPPALPPLSTPGGTYQYPPLPAMHPLPSVPGAQQQFMAQPVPPLGPVATPFHERPMPGPSATPDIRPPPGRAPPFDTTATPGPSTSRRNRGPAGSAPPTKKARTEPDRSRDVVICIRKK